jgi:lysophospholipase L1-like esterase
MGIEQIDKNFKPSGVSSNDLVWQNCNKPPFDVRGVYYSEKDNCYMRFPADEGEKIGLGYMVYADCSAGGRIRFTTNSPKIAIKVVGRVAEGVCSSSSGLTNLYGVSVYNGKKFMGKIAPELKNILSAVGETPLSYFAGAETAYTRMQDFRDGKFKVEFAGEISFAKHTDLKPPYDVTLCLPLYGGVREVLVGVQEGFDVLEPPKYKHDKYICFYGSSITHGGCATRPGNDYVNLLSRMLDSDVYNLGLTGSARGGRAIEQFMAKLDPSIYFIDYDHNAPDAEHLRKTHYPLYQALRKAHPQTPIVFVSKVGVDYYLDTYQERLEVIRSTVEKAKEEGDKNVYFIDGSKIFPFEFGGDCTVDGCHPNDLGFYLMAKAFYPVLKDILEK